MPKPKEVRGLVLWGCRRGRDGCEGLQRGDCGAAGRLRAGEWLRGVEGVNRHAGMRCYSAAATSASRAFSSFTEWMSSLP